MGGVLRSMQDAMSGRMGAGAGTENEWNAFDKAGFDQLSNEGITGSMSGNTGGMSGGNMAGLMGGGGGNSQMAHQQGLQSGPGGAADMSKFANIPSLMNMARPNAQQMQQQQMQQKRLQQMGQGGGMGGGMNPHMQGLMMRGQGG